MENYQAGTEIILDKRRKKNNGKFPVKLRVTFNGKQKLYSTQIALTEKEFEEVQNPNSRKNNKEIRLLLAAMEQKAENIIKMLPRFSFEVFERHFHSRGGNMKSIYSAFEKYISKLYDEGRAGTASSYECALHSLQKVSAKSQLTFSDVDETFLKTCEKKMIASGISSTTIGIYARCIRTLFNEAIEMGIISREFYPFGKRRYQIPASRNIKKALPASDIQKLFSYKALKGSTEHWAIDMWKFSYLCNGMNVKDIAQLKFKNIDSDEITFMRAKTVNTTREKQKQIVVPLLNETRAILSRWQSNESSPNNYVFGILKDEYDSKIILAKVRQATKTINRYVKRIAKQLEIEKKVTTYTARHSWATMMYNNDAPMTLLSDGLGHSDVRSTQNYVNSLDSTSRKKFAERLTVFA